MKICFIGLGSIAERHIKNLRVMYGSEMTIDVLRSGKGKPISSALQSLIDGTYETEDRLETKYDAIFITNPTSEHYRTLKRYHDLSDAFFIEKPVFLTGNEETSVFERTDKKYYVACPLRYMNVIRFVKENIDFRKVYAVRSISSSYLPDWRQDVDYRNVYSSHRELGGGVSLDLIHEWDYIQYLVGFPQKINCIIGKKSHLEINSDDIAIYIAEYEDKTVELHLDYYGRKTQRRLEIFGEDDTIEVDLIKQKICYLDEGRKVDLAEERDDYQKRELRHFFDIVNGKETSDNNIEDACRVLRLARGEL